MGIGNTTPSSAIAAVMTGLSVGQVVGRGTGIDDQGLERKIKVIEQALVVNQPDKRIPSTFCIKLVDLRLPGWLA